MGAGASYPFRFPLGAGLCTLVIDRLKTDGDTRPFLIELGFSDEKITEFQTQLRFSGITSVDAFLEHRPEFKEVGKAAIAAELIRVENQDILWSSENAGGWMKYLFGHLTAPFDEFGKNRIAFITFNYDRSLEHFLYTSVYNLYGKGDEQTKSAVERIPLIHLHGRLGFLPWQQSETIGSDKIRPYQPDLTAENIQIAAKNIKIIHEAMDAATVPEFVQARQLLDEAERIYIMGFGFARQNVERLELHKLQKSVVATAHDLTVKEYSAIRNAISPNLQLIQSDCMALMRNNVLLD